MTTSKKEFILSHCFENVPNLKEDENIYSPEEEHFDTSWYIGLSREEENVCAYLHVEEKSEEYSIETEYEIIIISANGRNRSEKRECTFNSSEKCGYGSEFLSWEKLLKDYLIDGKLAVEAHVKVLKMTGIKKKKLRNFDESMNVLSDVALVAGEKKFYVLKLFLASHSSYFKSLLLGNFEESKKSEIELKDIDSRDFQCFLEVLHGEDAINDDTVVGIVRLADMYDAPTAHRRCEQFLMKESEKSLKEKLELAAKYKMRRVKNKCLSEIKTVADIQSVLPGNLEEMDPSIMAAVLQKAMTHLINLQPIDMSTSKKKFTMTRVFVDQLDDAEDYNDFHLGEEHFHMHWNIYLSRENGNAELLFFLNDLDPVDEDSESTDETFFIEAEIDVQMLLENRRIEIKNQKVICQSLDDDYFHKVRFMSWEDLRRKCSVYGEVKIEVHFEITKMSGVLARKTVNFDEKMKEFSDVVLVVGEEKFYVSKLFLSFQSAYFKALLLGNFEESKKSEVILQDIDHWEFQKFLEVLYGGNAIDDDYFVSILRLADMYDAPIARRKCEEFLMEKSKKTLREKLELSMEYRMNNAKEKFLSDIKTVADIRSVVPENFEEMDHSLMATLFKKALYPLK
ncbi:hypothetical protein CRE_21420 [Caenorhabditis remanei]|uniref:BTB domain-containing protein n=1 Tax=Caenorhabditis remanei TaxID=31234 RepID=E3MUV0_CAERE|nr:hypothetical protein CRE_21420 [Caenorhabditis remanei]